MDETDSKTGVIDGKRSRMPPVARLSGNQLVYFGNDSTDSPIPLILRVRLKIVTVQTILLFFVTLTNRLDCQVTRSHFLNIITYISFFISLNEPF